MATDWTACGISVFDSGIYAITNKVTGEQYIGSATWIGSRWEEHRQALRLGKHHNRDLQSAWTRDGADAFRFEVVEVVSRELPVSELREREFKLIRSMRPAYNIRGKPAVRLPVVRVADEEFVTVREAGEILKVSKVKMSQLIREGILQTHESALDKRVKLMRRADVERLAQTLRPSRRDDAE